jgi:hypothetical protein
MQKLRILLYGDDRVDDTPGEFSFGITDLSRFISDGLRTVADVEVTFVHRHQRDRITKQVVQGANKLAWQFLSDYDEIWIFGDRQANFDSNDIKTAEPYNELDEYERAVLLEWMKTGGVLATGDHARFADPIASNVCMEDHREFIGLGAALGKHVPRAHQLREWKGAPTNCTDGLHDNQNTIDGPDPQKLDFDGDTLQLDGTPQTLLSQSTKHKLFSWVNSAGQVVPITVFPDHMHEGKVLAPTAQELDDDWPNGSPGPDVVARGNDKRPFAQGREYSLVVAFDGDPVNVGRIVADSSFHHYLNINLRKIDGRDNRGNPLPGTALGQIAQYYCNLALWLAPKSIREAIKVDLFFRLATHPLIQSVKGTSGERLGNTARRAAEVEAGASNLFQILGLETPNEGPVDDLLSTAFLAEAPNALLVGQPTQPRTEAVLGAIVQEFHDFFSDHGIRSPHGDESIPKAEIVNRGFMRAFRSGPD